MITKHTFAPSTVLLTKRSFPSPTILLNPAIYPVHAALHESTFSTSAVYRQGNSALAVGNGTIDDKKGNGGIPTHTIRPSTTLLTSWSAHWKCCP